MKISRKNILYFLVGALAFALSGIAKLEKLFALPFETIKHKRTKGVYRFDKSMSLRKSQNNPELKVLYKEFLQHPNSHLAHKLLHTHYVDRSAKIALLRQKNIF